MRKLKSLVVIILALLIFVSGIPTHVSADTATDLKSMKVYAVDASGNKKEVDINFSPGIYTYDLTVMSNTVSISIEAEAAVSTSEWSIEKDGINTKMDFGKNYTVVNVKASTGAVNKYILNTTKLTSTEEATYKAPEDTKSDKNDRSDDNEAVKVGKKQMSIISSFDKNKIPEGFKKSSAEYKGTKFDCIKGEVKDITAFYLKGEDAEGFYIYDPEENEFYQMQNIMIKIRMYTVVNPKQKDSCLKNYETKTVTIIDQEVKAWVLDEEEGMYLVYAMNWNGDTSLYCYDDDEKCFQRYIVDNDSNTQMTAANKAYGNLQDKYNGLVDKYNVLLKIMCGLIIVIIILIFIVINLALNRKEKRVKKGVDNDGEDFVSDKSTYISDDISENMTDQTEADPAATMSENDSTEAFEESDSNSEIKDDEKSKKKKKAKKALDRGYGDEPTFGIKDPDGNGFYGGEVAAEDEVLIDLTDEEQDAVSQKEIDDRTKEVQQ